MRLGTEHPNQTSINVDDRPKKMLIKQGRVNGKKKVI
jgi:hypothetical protein